jgi:hypothetical protein
MLPSWLLIHAGLTSAESPWYLFWSGIGADWTRLLALGGLLRFSQTLKQRHSERMEQHERHHRERMGHK